MSRLVLILLPSNNARMNLIQTITVVLVRLYGFGWGLQGLVKLLSVVGAAMSGGFHAFSLVSPAAYLVGAVVSWSAAPWLAGRIAGDQVAPLPEATVPQRVDLYATAFVALGAYFMLQSFGNAFNWLHYFMVSRQDSGALYKEEKASFYALTEVVLTLVAGVATLCLSQRLAKKLTQWQAI